MAAGPPWQRNRRSLRRRIGKIFCCSTNTSTPTPAKALEQPIRPGGPGCSPISSCAVTARTSRNSGADNRSLLALRGSVRSYRSRKVEISRGYCTSSEIRLRELDPDCELICELGTADRGPKAVDATGVDDVALLGVLQHRQKRAGAVIDAAPADVERALPFVAAVGNHAAAAANTGVVEQQVDVVGLVTVGNLVAKALDLRPVGDIDDVRRDAQPLRQSRRLAQPLRFRHAGRRDVAHRDIAGFRHQLANQLAA